VELITNSVISQKTSVLCTVLRKPQSIHVQCLCDCHNTDDNVYAGYVDGMCDSCNMVFHSTVKLTYICWQLTVCHAVYLLWLVGTVTPYSLINHTTDSSTFTLNCLCTYIMCCKWSVTSNTKVSLRTLVVSVHSGTATHQELYEYFMGAPCLCPSTGVDEIVYGRTLTIKHKCECHW
jgi:hypothetical protein